MILLRALVSSRLLLLHLIAEEPCRKFSTVDLSFLKPDVVLSLKNRKAYIQRLKLFKVAKNSNGTHVKKAAVLIPLCMYKGELGFLYTLRSTKLSSNRGQVSFPGGMKDYEDSSLEETALRETWEELRIPRNNVHVWGSGNLVSRKNVSVMPVLGYIGELDPNALQVNKEEVQEAFVLHLKDLCNPSNYGFTQFKDCYTLPTYTVGKYRIWGLTAFITHIVLTALVPEVYKHKLIYLESIVQCSAKTLS